MGRTTQLNVRTAERGKRRLEIEAARADTTASEVVRNGLDAHLALAEALDVPLVEAIAIVRDVARQVTWSGSEADVIGLLGLEDRERELV